MASYGGFWGIGTGLTKSTDHPSTAVRKRSGVHNNQTAPVPSHESIDCAT